MITLPVSINKTMMMVMMMAMMMTIDNIYILYDNKKEAIKINFRALRNL